MFDLHTKSSKVTITNFHIHTSSTQTEIVEIYTRKGSHVGYERRPSAWTLIGEVSVTGRGYGNPTMLPAGAITPVTIEPNQTQTFYITLQNSPHMVYTIGTGTTDPIVSDANVEIMEGVGKGYLFRGTVQQRRWNGAVEYKVDDGSSSNNSNVAGQLTTSFDGGTSEAGNMFNVEHRQSQSRDVRITNFQLHIASTAAVEHVEIYHRIGSHRNYERRPGAWTKLNNSPIEVQGEGTGQHTALPPNSFDPVIVKPGEVHSFYVTLTTSQNLVYSVGSSTDVDGESIVAHNDDIAVMQGVGKGYLFGGTIDHRLWNGVVEYEVL